MLNEADEVISTGGYFIKSFSIIGVNLYMMSTGYLMFGREFKVNRLVNIWSQTVFYSVTIGLLMSVLTGRWDTIGIIKSCLPVITIEYWYVTAYLILLFFMPAINKMVSVLSRKEAYRLLLLIAVVFSAWKSAFPNNGLLETGYLQGYGIVWMICMYLYGAIFKVHPLSYRKRILLLVYMICLLLTFIENLFCRQYGILDSGNKVFDYNHIFILGASITMFTLFLKINVKNVKKGNAMAILAKHTLAVYLITEQFRLKAIIWSAVSRITISDSYLMSLIASLAGILMVFIICIAIDIIRKSVFTYLNIDQRITGIIENMRSRFLLV